MKWEKRQRRKNIHLVVLCETSCIADSLLPVAEDRMVEYACNGKRRKDRSARNFCWPMNANTSNKIVRGTSAQSQECLARMCASQHSNSSSKWPPTRNPQSSTFCLTTHRFGGRLSNVVRIKMQQTHFVRSRKVSRMWLGSICRQRIWPKKRR